MVERPSRGQRNFFHLYIYSEVNMVSESYKIQSNLAEIIAIVSSILAKTQVSVSVTPQMMNLASVALMSMEDFDVAEKFITHSISWWPKILIKDEVSLADNCSSIFSDLPEAYIDDVRLLLNDRSEHLLPLREKLWRVLQGTVRCSIRHIHRQRQPKLSDGGGIVYQQNFMPSVKLKALAAEWEVELSV
jgi:hypothetical protein